MRYDSCNFTALTESPRCKVFSLSLSSSLPPSLSLSFSTLASVCYGYSNFAVCVCVCVCCVCVCEGVGAELWERLHRQRRHSRQEHGEALRNSCSVEVGVAELGVVNWSLCFLFCRSLCSHSWF